MQPLMQASNSRTASPQSLGTALGTRLRERLSELQGEIDPQELTLMLSLVEEGETGSEAVRDGVSTRLMECFKNTRNRQCFGLLYELNGAHLLLQVVSRLRRYASQADPHDVLQEVFVNVYRYPHRFDSTRSDAFRVWSAMIVRNTVLKHLRTLGRGGRLEVPFEDLSDHPEGGQSNPLGDVIEDESQRECSRVYLTYLQLYLRFYSMLSEREQRALQLVEVQDASYRQAAEELSIKLENLKMVIFRARRKIHRAMRRVFDGLPPDCRPARQKRSQPSAVEDGEDSGRGPTVATGGDA